LALVGVEDEGDAEDAEDEDATDGAGVDSGFVDPGFVESPLTSEDAPFPARESLR
jgi:hypothetical protein